MNEGIETTAKQLFFKHFHISGDEPDLELLRAVIVDYSNIPYENITKIIRKFESQSRDDRLRSPLEVITGFVEDRTGGTCFSLTFCLGSILSKAGYRCYPVMADMKKPNIHCALAVHIGSKRYLVDPGYLLGEPVELSGEAVRLSTSFGEVELRPRSGQRYDLYTIAGNDIKWRYRVKTSPVSQVLFMRYWQESFSLPMMNSLQLTKLSENGHLYVRNHHLRLQRGGEKKNENIRAGLESRIETEFGIPGALTASAREHLERLKESWRTHGRASRAKHHR